LHPVTVDGKGPIGRIIADADAQGNVRAYVDHPQTHFPLIAPINNVAVIVLPIAAEAVGHV
jgi:redox-regulated HSP33 family molecular chaperone